MFGLAAAAVPAEGSGAAGRAAGGMFNHLPWYTERKNDLSSRLNAAESMRAAASLNAKAQQALDSQQPDDSRSVSGSGSDVGSEEFDADGEILDAAGDTSVQSIASAASFAPAEAGGSSLPPLTDRRCTRRQFLLLPSAPHATAAYPPELTTCRYACATVAVARGLPTSHLCGLQEPRRWRYLRASRRSE